MLTAYFNHTRERLLTYIFDIMKLKIPFLLNGESPKYIAKLFSLSIYSKWIKYVNYLKTKNPNYNLIAVILLLFLCSI